MTTTERNALLFDPDAVPEYARRLIATAIRRLAHYRAAGLVPDAIYNHVMSHTHHVQFRESVDFHLRAIVPCPTCAAPIGAQCRKMYEWSPPTFHVARGEAMQAAAPMDDRLAD